MIPGWVSAVRKVQFNEKSSSTEPAASGRAEIGTGTYG